MAQFNPRLLVHITTLTNETLDWLDEYEEYKKKALFYVYLLFIIACIVSSSSTLVYHNMSDIWISVSTSKSSHSLSTAGVHLVIQEEQEV